MVDSVRVAAGVVDLGDDVVTKDRLWAIYLKKNPQLARDPVRLSSKGLRQLFDQTWSVAYRAGKDAGRDTFGVFDGIFGGGKR